ncbi:MAG: HD-GYP domain-containing protein [Firmicutes bacterium]|nr:HD-GYP domain-containing protein [Bacillota bacterium]
MPPAIIFLFNVYLTDLYTNEGGLEKTPKRLKTVSVTAGIGELLIIVSQFTGLYYTFDAQNRYQRADGFILCYVIPLLLLILQLSVVIQYREKLNKLKNISLILFTFVPLVASVIQIFAYGISLTNITSVGLVIVLYMLTLIDMNTQIQAAHEYEVKLLKDEQKKMRRMLLQTSSALASAIDAKDRYTHGHSRRVAEYSQMIAEIAGKSDSECWDIYLAGLLHDVGKIGVPDEIINKTSRLSDEEFAKIKEHPTIGRKILKKINMTPFLSIGADYHHERYDGKGYPNGAKGEEIPEIARIIAVADAYDAMTSKRSYREPLPQAVVREEIVKGSGTQFDPRFAEIMLKLIDDDKDYNLKENGDEPY